MYTPDKSNWLNPNIEYLFNTEIIEYDIQSAGLSLIREYSLLTPDEIVKLERLSKVELNITIGKLQRDRKGFSRDLLDRFTQARSDFISNNELDDAKIIAVKKDAIFTIGRCPVTSFGKITFIPKQSYSSYVRFSTNSNIEIYYNDEGLDVKGIGDASLARHRLYMLEFIRKCISLLESRNPSIRRYLRTFIDNYKHGKLDESYYLEFNNMSYESNPMFNLQKIIVPLFQICMRELIL